MVTHRFPNSILKNELSIVRLCERIFHHIILYDSLYQHVTKNLSKIGWKKFITFVRNVTSKINIFLTNYQNLYLYAL